MTNYARVLNDTVQEIINFNPEGCFHPDVAALFRTIPIGTEVGAIDNHNGTFTNTATVVKPATLPTLKAQKIAAIRAHFGNMVDALKADAAPYEVETWSVQTAEYSAWVADNFTPTPYISALAAARGLTLDALMGKLGAKVAGLATIQGTQHALETAANAATTEAQLQEILG